MRWIDALKEYNARQGGKYVIPRKGTPEYEEVRRIMDLSITKEVVPRAPRRARSPSDSPKRRTPKSMAAMVCMPHSEYMAEHDRLTKVLHEGKKSELRKEAARQKKEVAAKDPKPERFIQEVVATMEKGALTKTAKRAGMKPLEFAKEVIAHPEEHTEKTRKRSQFLVNIQRSKEADSE